MRKKKERPSPGEQAAAAEDSVSGALGAANAAPKLSGNVDVISHEIISGWAWNPLDPEESVALDIYDGSELLIRIRADIYRGDLREAGIGGGRHGFSVPNPAALLPLARHHIAVRRAADGVDLPGSPKWLLRPEAGFDPSLAKFLHSAASASANVARRPEDLDEQLTLTLRVLDQLLNARNSLHAEASPSSGPGLQGFLIEARASGWIRELAAKVETEFTPIRFKAVENPLVSIVIPVCNEFRTTYNCLKSISENLPKCSFEIIIVDDGSRDASLFAGFVISGAVRLIRNTKNEGFLRACNAGAADARGKYLLFLRNDTLVRPKWLDELVATFDHVPNVGIAGSKLLFENG